ncbi:MAG: DUF1287 domain-containing protein [Oscillospiraceae bacterium]
MIKSKSKRTIAAALAITLVLTAALCLWLLSRFNLLPQKAYSAADFGISAVYSPWDFNENGIDDYTDIMLGARADAENKPAYNGKYFDGGYPPDEIGVCTDVIWRAFKNAGYCLRDMVDADISENPKAYPNITTPDSNIDFRRVVNLRVFFDRNAERLTTDTEQIGEWQPGDIVIFGNNKHIGIVSDKRNKDGKPYIIHNGGQPCREEDYLKRASVTAHYRFDASKVNSNLLIPWHEQ